jgi:cell division protein FtsB
MVKVKFLGALFAGTLVYVTVSLAAGQDGLYAVRHTSAQRNQLAAHTEALEAHNQSLRLELQELENNEAVIASAARKLGYIMPGETMVTINGLALSEPVPRREIGVVLRGGRGSFVPEWQCKLAGVIAAWLTFMYLLLTATLRRRSPRPRPVLAYATPVSFAPPKAVPAPTAQSA